jgi:CRISPR-associated protein Csb1
LNSIELFDLLLRGSQGGLAAMRAVTKLQPIDGEGGKIFPPTYAEGTYAFEKRVRDGQEIQTVLLDSVQSQVNRLEERLLYAYQSERLNIPVFEMNFPGHELITSLTVPHRVHDAILRDSLWDGKPFRESKEGKRLVAARAWNATPFFEYAPTVLLFGTWDSQSGGGVNTAKVARSLVSEIVGFGAVRGVRTSSRIDPLGIRLVRDVVVKLEGSGDVWRFQEPPTDGKKAKKTEGAKTVRPSEINHGNIAPSITDPETGPGGVTFRYAEQTTVLSFTQLRKLRFTDGKGESNPERDAAGRAVIAALGLYAVALQWEDGYQLRSRCQLIPVESPSFKVIGRVASEQTDASFDTGAAEAALKAAIENATKHGLKWHGGKIALDPKPDLLKLVQYSDQSIEPVEGEKEK